MGSMDKRGTTKTQFCYLNTVGFFPLLLGEIKMWPVVLNWKEKSVLIIKGSEAIESKWNISSYWLLKYAKSIYCIHSTDFLG